ncbi:MAG: hypothetical protein ABI580_06225 [Burkholderiaceae bacterium]
MSLAFLSSLSANARDIAQPEAVSVTVFPDRYVSAGMSFSNVEALAVWARPIAGRLLWLDACGAGSTGRLLAAVERFHTLYADGIQIRAFRAGESGCLGAIEQASQSRVSDVADYLPYYPSDRTGRSLVP